MIIMSAISPQYYEFIEKLDENHDKLPTSVTSRAFQPEFEFNNSSCYLCNGYYGPSFGEPVCVTCHEFLYPDIPHHLPNSYILSEKTDDGDSGNDEPSVGELLYNDRRLARALQQQGVRNWAFKFQNSLDSENSPEDPVEPSNHPRDWMYPSRNAASGSNNGPRQGPSGAQNVGPSGGHVEVPILEQGSSGHEDHASGSNSVSRPGSSISNREGAISKRDVALASGNHSKGPSGNIEGPGPSHSVGPRSSSRKGPSGSQKAGSSGIPRESTSGSPREGYSSNRSSGRASAGPRDGPSYSPNEGASSSPMEGPNGVLDGPRESNINNPREGFSAGHSSSASTSAGPREGPAYSPSEGASFSPREANIPRECTSGIPREVFSGAHRSNGSTSGGIRAGLSAAPRDGPSHSPNEGASFSPREGPSGVRRDIPGGSNSNPTYSLYGPSGSGPRAYDLCDDLSGGLDYGPLRTSRPDDPDDPDDSSSDDSPYDRPSPPDPPFSYLFGGNFIAIGGQVYDDGLGPAVPDDGVVRPLPSSLSCSIAALSTPRLPDNLAPGLVESLPSEVVLCVFSYLDDLSLSACARVCVRWARLVRARVPPPRWAASTMRRWPLFHPLFYIRDWHKKYEALVESCFCRNCVVQMCMQSQPPFEENAWRRNRLRNEIKMLRNTPPEGCAATPLDPKCCHWQAVVTGPVGSPYEGGVFYLYIQVPYSYPMSPPVVRFLTRVLHPNVSRHGDVGIDSVHHNWSLALTISKLLISIQSLLTDPYTAVCMEPEVGEMYVNERARFERIARRWTWRYAMHDMYSI